MYSRFLLFALIASFIGCSAPLKTPTSAPNLHPSPKSAVLLVHGGQSASMDAYMHESASYQGLEMQPGLPQGTKATQTADVMIAYSYQWGWAICTYLQTLTIEVFDGKSGDLLATGTWNNGLLPDCKAPRQVVDDLMSLTFSRFRPKAISVDPPGKGG